MKPSALRLLNLTFLCIHVEIDPAYEGNASEFDFDGAFIHWGLRHGRQSDDGLTWWVGVEFATKSEEEKRCPYNIEVKAVGLFNVNDEVPQENRERFVFENGAALVYGAIREMVSMTAARSAFGAIMLPTASFYGAFEEHQKNAQEQKASEPEAE
jgi:preprotein translocase subunit SecB